MQTFILILVIYSLLSLIGMVKANSFEFIRKDSDDIFGRIYTTIIIFLVMGFAFLCTLFYKGFKGAFIDEWD